MQQTLWGERLPQRRRKKAHPLISAQPYSITGANDCEILGHTLREWDLAGCTTCLDCSVSIYCPRCTSAHPQDASAIPLLCEKHQESTVRP